MRKEDQERILSELESRISEDVVSGAAHGGLAVHEMLEASMYHERRRLKEDRKSPVRDRDRAFWEGIESELRGGSPQTQKTLLRRAVRHYGEEIAGNFDPRVYQAVTRVLPPALGVLMNAVSPMRLVRRLPDLPQLDDAIVIQGETDHLRRLHERGTVILVPTHVSNLDSMVIGFALYRLGLPPFIYGAGLNLFTNPVLGFFMHNLGAYTVDRKKRDPLYKYALKEYATLTLEFGHDNLFFPGGTRSRSGAIERKLKLGLVGTGLRAYINNLRRNATRPKIFIVPTTLCFQLVLEAETLIDDFLKEVGKARYIIEDDEFSQPKTVFGFLNKLFSLDSKLHVTVGRGMDPFGNAVDDEGESLDPCGRHIDTTRYVLRKGEPQVLDQRDIEYTRELGERLGESFMRNNVIDSTNVAAKAILGLAREQNPKLSTLRLLRTGGREESIALADVYRETDRILDVLRRKSVAGKVRLSRSVEGATEDVIADGLAHFASYHDRPAAMRKGDRVFPIDRALLLYYQNRLEGYGVDEAAGRRPVLTRDHRTLA